MTSGIDKLSAARALDLVREGLLRKGAPEQLPERPVALFVSGMDVSTFLHWSGIQVNLRKVRGRGQIELLEQPTASNYYTAVVQVDDQDASGSAWYEFTLDW